MSWDNRTWIFVKTEYITDPSGSGVNFNDFKQTSYSTTRKSLDGLEFMLKYDGDEPSDVALINTADGLAKYMVNGETGEVTSGSGWFTFNHSDVIAITATSRWTQIED